MNQSELDLIHQYLDGTLSEESMPQLQSLLRENVDARKLLRDLSTVETKLQDLAATNGATLQLLAAPLSAATPPTSSRTILGSFFARPLTAAAAGLIFGLFSASVAWAYGSPRIQPLIKQVLEIANAGFENEIAPLAEGVPIRYGVWSGDHAELTEAQQGITPREGKKMFRFLRSDSNRPSANPNPLNGNSYQVIDVRAWHDTIADGTAMVDWSAWFNSVPESAGGPMKFMTSVWAFSGETDILPRNWAEKLYQEIAYSSRTVVADDDPQSWQRTAGSMIVPPDTDFLVVELKAIPTSPSFTDGAVIFSGQYADDVQLVLRTNARVPSVKPSHPQ
ncbi:hypothetical protein BH11VER1_BH11VER1_30760 [soil metagenome]